MRLFLALYFFSFMVLDFCFAQEFSSFGKNKADGFARSTISSQNSSTVSHSSTAQSPENCGEYPNSTGHHCHFGDCGAILPTAQWQASFTKPEWPPSNQLTFPDSLSGRLKRPPKV